MKASLTEKLLKGLKADGRAVDVWDDRSPGLVARVRRSRRVYFWVKYRTRAGSRQRWHQLGQHGADLTLEQARKAARKALNAVSEGRDPALEKREERNAKDVADLAQRYIEQHAEVRKKASSLRNDRLLLRHHVLPALGRLAIKAVTRADVTDLHYAMRATPYAANRALALINKMMNCAEAWGLRPEHTNPCTHVEKYTEEKRERRLDDAELAALGRALSEAEAGAAEIEVDGRTVVLKREAPEVVAFIRLLALLGCRDREIRTAKWSWIDWKRGVLQLPDAKRGPRDVVLNTLALGLLEGLKESAVSEYIVPGRDGSAPLENIAKAWRRICLRGGLENLRIHDLRHLHGTVAGDLDLPLSTIAALLGHADVRTSGRYVHAGGAPLRAAADRVACHVAAALAGKPDARVVSIDSARR